MFLRGFVRQLSEPGADAAGGSRGKEQQQTDTYGRRNQHAFLLFPFSFIHAMMPFLEVMSLKTINLAPQDCNFKPDTQDKFSARVSEMRQWKISCAGAFAS